MMFKRRIQVRNTRYATRHAKAKGAALLVVLFVIMAITVLSLGFLSESDVQLACGQNMGLRTQMDHLAASGLEHAKGLILHPQDVDAEYWTGATSLQLAADSSDYYDVTVVRDDSDNCNYLIDCNSYRLLSGEEIGRNSLSAELRLDPCIAFWAGGDTTLWPSVHINGDVYCGGGLQNSGTIDGDVFANDLNGTITGRHKPVDDLSLAWPRVTVDDFRGEPGVSFPSGDYVLTGGTRIEGMLLVEGDLTVRGSNNAIVAGKNLPALYVTGDLIIEKDASLQITGLAVVDSRLLVNGDADGLDVLGGLFIRDYLAETAHDSSGNGNAGTLHNGPTWRPAGGQSNGALQFDGIDDYIVIEQEANFDLTNEITVSAWVNIDQVDKQWQAVVTKGDSAWRLSTYEDQRKFHFSVTGWPHYYAADGSTLVQQGVWRHICGTYDGTYIRLYVNGEEDANTPYTHGISTSDDCVCIGENLERTGRYWHGLIDDVRVYDRALDANDVRRLSAGVVLQGAGPIAHWKLNETGCNVRITAAPTKAAIWCWNEQGARERWGQAAGAFFRSVRRE
jgi:hypothetical protein